MRIYLGIIAMLSFFGAALLFVASSTIFQEIAAGLALLTHVICVAAMGISEQIKESNDAQTKRHDVLVFWLNKLTEAATTVQSHAGNLDLQSQHTNELLRWVGENQTRIQN